MNRTTRFTRLGLGLVLVTMLVLSSVSLTGAQEEKVLKIAQGAAGTEVIFDPSLASDTTSHTYIEMLFPGPAPRNEVTSVPEYGMADSWEISEDATVYTFNLRQDIPWVRWDADAGEVVQLLDDNGDPIMVTAHDFAYGAIRLMDPEIASDYGFLTADWTVGGKEYNGGEGAAEDVMIKALDDYTLEITSPAPAGFLLQVYGGWLITAQPQWLIEEYGDAWTLPEYIATYGNMVLKEYDPGNRVVVVKNPFWPGTESHPVPALDAIEGNMLDASAALAAFEAGELDAIEDFPLPDMARLKVERPDELFIVPRDCTYYYGFNVTKEPMDNVHMRRALSLAIDREGLVEFVTQGGEVPAGFFSRPNHDASPTSESYPDLGVKSDVEMAVAEFNMYLEDTGNTVDSMPVITLMHNTSEGHALIAQAIQQMWKDALGIEVSITNQEWQTYQDTLQTDSPQVWRLGWCWDYSDTHNGLNDVFRSDSGNNYTNWVNEDFDALLLEAAVMLDNDARREIYAEAEQILTWDDAVMAPIYFYTNQALIGTHVDGTPTQIGSWRYDKWDFK